METNDSPSNGRILSRRELLRYGAVSGTTVALGLLPLPSRSGTPGEATQPLRHYASRIIGPSGKPFIIGISPEWPDWQDPSGIPAQQTAIQFNHLVNHGISMRAHKGPDQWDFSGADWYVQHAQAANQSMIGMHLLWGSLQMDAVPAWIRNGGYNRQQLITLVEKHITAVMTRYRGVIGAYTVVNEMLDEQGVNDWWYWQLGPDYPQIAFAKARQVDPTATLIFNHYWNEGTVSNGYQYITLVETRRLRALGLIDAVGIQMHLWRGRPPKATVVAMMKAYGLPVWVTEFDSIQRNDVPNPEEEQAQITQAMIEAALESGVCDGFTTWGFSDKNSFWGAGAKACLWDANNAPKANYYALQRTLAAHVTLTRDTFLPLIWR